MAKISLWLILYLLKMYNKDNEEMRKLALLMLLHLWTQN